MQDEVMPDALIDRVVFGFNARIVNGAEGGLSPLRKVLAGNGSVSTPATKRADGYMQIMLHLVTEQGSPAGEARIDLYGRAVGKDLVFGDRCAIHLNGLTIMRGIIGSEAAGPPSLDGKLNVLSNRIDNREIAQEQLRSIGEAVEYVADAFALAFGERWQPTKLWVKAGEICRDQTSVDAVSEMRILHHAIVSGAIERRWDEYERIGMSDQFGIPTLRFVAKANGPEDKIYPKRRETRRLEVTCGNRRKVTELTGAVHDAFSSEGTRHLAAHLLSQAADRLDRLQRFVEEALAGTESIDSLLVALKSLIDRASGSRKPKGPRSDDAARDARTALSALLSIGFFDASGLHARHAIRRDLESLLGSEGPLDKHPRRVIYYLKPQYARACGLMRLPD